VWVNLAPFLRPDGTPLTFTATGLNYNSASGYGFDSGGYHLQFDGSDDYAVIATTNDLDYTTMTIQMIIKPTAFINYCQFFSSRSSTGQAGYYIGTFDGANSDNLTVNSYSPGGSQASIQPAVNLSTTAVSNIVAVLKPSQIYQYIDCASYHQNGYTTYPNTNTEWTIGAAAGTLNFKTRFKLYDIKIYNRELTLSEINRNYQAYLDLTRKNGEKKRRS
jgi:hypothetical protein